MIGKINPEYGNYSISTIVNDMLRVLEIDLEAMNHNFHELWMLTPDASIYAHMRLKVNGFNMWHKDMIDSGFNPDNHISI